MSESPSPSKSEQHTPLPAMFPCVVMPLFWDSFTNNPRPLLRRRRSGSPCPLDPELSYLARYRSSLPSLSKSQKAAPSVGNVSPGNDSVIVIPSDRFKYSLSDDGPLAPATNKSVIPSLSTSAQSPPAPALPSRPRLLVTSTNLSPREFLNTLSPPRRRSSQPSPSKSPHATRSAFTPANPDSSVTSVKRGPGNPRTQREYSNGV